MIINFKEYCLNESMFHGDFDEDVKKIFTKIQNNFNLDDLEYDSEIYGYRYRNEDLEFIVSKIDKDTLSYRDLFSRSKGFGFVDNYKIWINKDEIDCSFRLSKKIYNFFKNSMKKNDKKETIKKLSALSL